ncbi:MAG: heme biosynthesis HemY N-terminal domain-containing protein [Wenzhouxiangellaceae bacterium]|nr:heme biosynthesis HemY N-terminal domain-containing protein [Wenzhouxiangellaceae bacterium]
MKRLVLGIVVLVAVLAAIAGGAWLGSGLLENPGYVLIEFGGRRIQMSMLVLVAGVLAVWLLASLLIGFFRMPGRALRRLRARRERRNLDQGLLALSEGDWPAAEKALLRASRISGTTSAYLAAARAAQGQGASERRDEYLALADARFGKRHFATDLMRARMLAAQGDARAAIDVLEKLHLSKPGHEAVLKLLLQCYQECNRWHEVRLLVPQIQRAGIIDQDRADQLAKLAAARELESAHDASDLLRVQRSLKRGLRQAPEVVAAFARRALELDRPELAEIDLRRAIEDGFSDELLGLYAQADAGDRAVRIEQCRKWLRDKPDLAALQLALGRLYLAERNDEKAREHLQIAVRKSPDPSAYAALAQVLDRSGQLESAAQCYRNALRLEQGRAPDPLPPPDASTRSGAR